MSLNTKISPKLVSLVFAILVICFVIGFYALAVWTEPSQAPPEGNVPSPFLNALNISATGQSKAGGLILNTGGAPNGLLIPSGNVGIGETNPDERLVVDGNVYLKDSSMLLFGTNKDAYIYYVGGVLKVVGTLETDGYKSDQGTEGATEVVEVRDVSGESCQLSFENGLFVSTTCP